MFRLREHNRLRVDYFATNRRGDNVINRQILFGDETFWPATGLQARWTGGSSH